VPAAVSAVTAQSLADNDVEDSNQLQYLVPSMQVGTGAQGISIGIRGISSPDASQDKGVPGIQFSVDGIPTSRQEELSIPFFDTQRVEVLAGPQGTLYGFDSTGGAVNVINNAPVLGKEAANASVEVGNYDTKRFQAMVNLPLGDNWAFRASGTANYREGFVKLICPGPTVIGDCASNNSTNQNTQDDNNQEGRLQLLGKLSDNMQLRLIATIGRVSGNGSGDGNVGLNVGSDNIIHTISGNAEFGAWNPIPSWVSDHFEKFSAQFDGDFSNVHLTYLGSYSNYQTFTGQSSQWFGTPDFQGQNPASVGFRLQGFDQYQATYHELRLSNNDQGPVQWIVGANYWWEGIQESTHGEQVAGYYGCPPSGPNPGCVVGFAGNPNDFINNYVPQGLNPVYSTIFNPADTTNHQSESIFAHAVIAVTPEWHVTVGARESVDEISRIGTHVGGAEDANNTFWLDKNGNYCESTGLDCVAAIAADNNNNVNPGLIEDTPIYKFRKFNWTLGTDYVLTPAQMVYFNVSTGYKPGSFNDNAPPDGNFHAYNSESLTSFEVGYKAHTPTLDFTSDLYYYDYSSMQISESTWLPAPYNQAGTYFITAPSTLFGWENALHWAMTRDDSLTLQTAFETGHFKSDSADVATFFAQPGTPGALLPPCNGVVNQGNNAPLICLALGGKHLDGIPAAIVTLGYEHVFPLPNGASLRFNGTTRWSASTLQSQFSQGAYYHMAPYTHSNVDLEYRSSDGKWSTTAFVTNIENKVQFNSFQGKLQDANSNFASVTTSAGTFNAMGTVSQPRLWGVRESVSF
jgi:iron complex outermembrane receptor protein